ncbi:MAG: hypothetical protein KC933_37215, partial [Myxococcales bacterium]|nr:hypothetical protein [Myxococcales bacterium]
MRAPLAALALCLANLAACRSGPTPEELYVLRNQPRPLGPVALRDASTKTLRVRVWADEGHARAVMGWQVRFHEQVAAANPVLVANLGLELEVVTVRPWPRDGGRGDLIDDVNALMAHDKGDDVDLVIGLVTPLSTFNPTFSALGRANVLGRHIVMRSTDAPEEMAAFEQALRKASAEARADLYQARLRHKETLLLLHEVGHILGAPHVFMDRAVMSPHYDPQQDGFAPESLELMRMAVAAWEPGRGVPRETREAMAAHLEQRRWPGWSDEGRAQYARAFRTGRMPDEAPHEPTSPPRAAEPASKPAPLSPRERVAEALERGGLVAERAVWPAGQPEAPFEANVRIRYRDPGT